MLQLHNVQLRNFCQHDDLNLDFSGGITVILGPNGSGKSNLTNGIYSALTGSFHRGPGDATKCIGRNKDDPCSVQVTGSLHDRSFRIRREIRMGRDGQGKVSHGLWLDGQRHKTFKTAGEIESWLEKETGLPTDILSYFLFPGQLGLSGYANGRASERAEKFAALCGTQQFLQIREKYTKLLNEDRKRYDKACVALEYLDQALRSAEENQRAIDRDMTEWKRRIGSADLSLLLQERETELSEIAAAHTRLQQREKRLEALAKEHAIQEGHYEQAGVDCEKYETSIAECRRKQRELADRYAAVREELDRELDGENDESLTARLTASVQANEKRALLEKNIADTDAELAAIPDSRPVDTNENLKLRGELDTVLERIGSIESALSTLEAVIPILEKTLTDPHGEQTCVCPFCGADSPHWKKDIDVFREQEEQLVRESAEFSRLKTELEIRVRDRDRQQKQYESDQRQRTRLSVFKADQQRELALCPPFDRNAQARLIRLHDLRQSLDRIETRLPELEAQAEREGEQLRLKKNFRTGLHEKLRQLETETATLQTDTPQQRREELDGLNESARRLEDEIKQIGEISQRLLELEGSRTESLRQRQDLLRQKAEQSLLADASGTAELWFERCESALDWFHRDRLPRLMHKSFLDKLVQVVNHNLGRFRNPFSVRVNDDVSFKIEFADGQSRDSKALSVGESDLLGISFLGALNLTSAQKLGIMVIDEPTASLDGENLVLLFQVFEHWKKDLLRRNGQLIIVTHVEEMSGIADTVFRLPPRSDRSPGPGTVLLPA